MAATRPRICAAIVNGDLEAVKTVAHEVDIWEVRIDLIGPDWGKITGTLDKPWIACNRRREEGGNWQGSEVERIETLYRAIEAGAKIVDIELDTPDLVRAIDRVGGQAEIILSHHNLEETPPLEELREIIRQQIDVGADICKVVTTARSFADNLVCLRLIREFPEARVISFAMGSLGQISRILSPLTGGYLTYASVEAGRESAVGQITVNELRAIYETLEKL